MPERAARKRPRRNGGGRPKIDWGAAKTWFAANPDAGFGDVAKKFHVSVTAVRNHARAEGWEAYRDELVAEAAVRARSKTIRSLEERQADTIRVAERLRTTVLPDDNGDAPEIPIDVAVRTLPAYAKLEQLFEGEATERISVAEAKDAFLAVMRAAEITLVAAAEQVLPDGQRARLIAAFRAELPAAVDSALGGFRDVEP